MHSFMGPDDVSRAHRGLRVARVKFRSCHAWAVPAVAANPRSGHARSGQGAGSRLWLFLLDSPESVRAGLLPGGLAGSCMCACVVVVVQRQLWGQRGLLR